VHRLARRREVSAQRTHHAVTASDQTIVESANRAAIDRHVLAAVRAPLIERRTKFIFGLLPDIPDLLFESLELFPVSFHPAFRFSHDVLLLSQKILRAAFAAGGLPVANAVVREMHRVLRRSLADLTEPLCAPIATIAEGMKQFRGHKKEKAIGANS
jgi:hypothetical protein